MEEPARSLTIGARVDDRELARLDAAVALTRTCRAHFIAQATLSAANEVLRQAAPRDKDAEPDDR